MFNNKRYVFETRETRLRRIIKNSFLFLVSSFFFYTIICFILLLVSKQENQTTQEAFFKRRPDIIVVFTGDTGRIPYAIKMAKELNQSNILISGVHVKNSVETITKRINLDSINPNNLGLDYRAKNTVENVQRTLEFIRGRHDISNIIVISHDYHILRIKAILNDRIRKNENYSFYFSGVNSDLSSLRNIKILYKEVFKFFRTLAYLALADID